MRLLSVCALALAPLYAAPGDSIPARADAETFEAIVRHVTPADAELAWRSIPWRPSLSAGMRDGAQLDRPVLLWAMNGHPLGST